MLNPFTGEQWLQIPPDRNVIRRWTNPDIGGNHKLEWPTVPDPAHFSFVALGDTGDSEGLPPGQSPQDGVAQFMIESCAVPPKSSGAQFVVHLGDVVYMTGERRLYERNFRVPYSSLLTDDSTSSKLTFRLPFLPVPGNHDYYDLGTLAKFLSRVPIIGSGLRALSRELFSFNVPRGGSDMGASYMDAFVAKKDAITEGALKYEPGSNTKIPNRYYKYSVGIADFFALDSNTLDAPGDKTSQARIDAGVVHAELKVRSQQLHAELTKARKSMEDWRSEYRTRLSQSDEKLKQVVSLADAVSALLIEINQGVAAESQVSIPISLKLEAKNVCDIWNTTVDQLHRETHSSKIAVLIEKHDTASDKVCDLLEDIDSLFSDLKESEIPDELRNAQHRCEAALHEWALLASPAPEEISSRLKQLSEEALDVQRELADELRRMHYLPEDHDVAQLKWLDDALQESETNNPNGWRIIILHHPLYTTIGNHCEKPDVLSVRENLQAVLGQRVHLVLSGHSHAFEWFKSDLMPNTGIVVSGGGGQVTLRRSVLDPKRFERNHDRYLALRNAQVKELALAGRGPSAPDGSQGNIYHFLSVSVTQDKITVKPIGVRWVNGRFRSESPMPVYHVPRLSFGTPEWNSRLLTAIEIRRNAPPTAIWQDTP